MTYHDSYDEDPTDSLTTDQLVKTLMDRDDFVGIIAVAETPMTEKQKKDLAEKILPHLKNAVKANVTRWDAEREIENAVAEYSEVRARGERKA